MKIKDRQTHAANMIAARATQDKMFRWMEDAARGHWEWPGDKPTWMHTMRSTDLQDALKSASQILSTVDPRIKFQPLSSDKSVRDIANNIENNLEWHLKNASRRLKSNLVARTTYSALLYGKVAAKVVYIPWQKKLLKDMGQDVKHLEAAERYGPFTVMVRNPSHIYETFSDYGLEEVLEMKKWSIVEFKSFWGDKAAKELMAQTDDEAIDSIVTYDYVNHTDRHIWAKAYAGSLDHTDASGSYELYNDKHGLNFIPWIIETVGQDFIGIDDLDCMPLLYSVYKSGLIDTQNIMLTLGVSEMMAYAEQPRNKKTSYNPDNIVVDHSQPGGSVDLQPGENFEVIQPYGFNGGIMEVINLTKAMTGKTTVSQMLQNPDMKADVPFSAMNLIFQLGANTLQPYKELAQDSIAEICTHMLYWVKQSKKPLVSFNGDRLSGEYGLQYVIDPDMYEFDGIYIEVELTADVPTDRMARINGATMMHQQLQYPLVKALEQCGVNNPENAIELWKQEQLESAELQIDIQNRQAEAQMLQQMKMAQMQQMQQQMQQQQMQQQQMQQQQAGPAPLGRDPAMQGFNPAAGGQPPIQGGAPIREQASGRTRGGEEIAGMPAGA